MSIVPVQTDYTDKDFDSVRLRLQNLVRSVFPEWTDYNVANFGNILLELYAFVADILVFYQDNQALNSRIVTATQRRALLALVKLIDYTPATASAATASLSVTINASPVAAARIPVGSVVAIESTAVPVRFQTLTEVLFPAAAGTLTQTVDVENSETQLDAFTSTGLGNQEFRLAQAPYLDGATVPVAGNGTYTQVEDFLSSVATDLHFTVTVDQFDRATLRFGNGVNGAVPVGDVGVTYKTGGGTVGNVEVGTLTKLEGSFTDDNANPVTYIVNNAAAASGGADRESSAQIKQKAPASIRVLTRTVALEDYEINAELVPGVGRALMLTADQDSGVAENNGILFIIPTGGGLPTQTLKDAVYTQVTVTYPNTITFQLTVQDPVYKTVDVSARVAVAQGYEPTAVKTAIVAALTEFFSPEITDPVTGEVTQNDKINFGGKIKDNAGNIISELAWSDVFNAVRDVAGIRKVVPNQFLLNGAEADVTLTTSEFPTLGTVTVINDATGTIIP